LKEIGYAARRFSVVFVFVFGEFYDFLVPKYFAQDVCAYIFKEETRKAVEEVKLTLEAQLKATKEIVAGASLTAQNASRLPTNCLLGGSYLFEEQFVH